MPSRTQGRSSKSLRNTFLPVVRLSYEIEPLRGGDEGCGRAVLRPRPPSSVVETAHRSLAQSVTFKNEETCSNPLSCVTSTAFTAMAWDAISRSIAERLLPAAERHARNGPYAWAALESHAITGS
jgi:hypothetical protein